MAKVERPEGQPQSVAEKRKIVEFTMQSGASVARVARQFGVSATTVFYRAISVAQADCLRADSIRLLPVSVSEPAVNSASESFSATAVMPATGTIEIEFPRTQLRIEGGAGALLRVGLESLR